MGKYGLLLNANPEEVGPAGNGLEYALYLDDVGHNGEVVFDGEATQWPGTCEEKPEHRVNDYAQEVNDRELIGGACSFCANAFDVREGCEAAGVDLLTGPMRTTLTSAASRTTTTNCGQSKA